MLKFTKNDQKQCQNCFNSEAELKIRIFEDRQI